MENYARDGLTPPLPTGKTCSRSTKRKDDSYMYSRKKRCRSRSPSRGRPRRKSGHHERRRRRRSGSRLRTTKRKSRSRSRSTSRNRRSRYRRDSSHSRRRNNSYFSDSTSNRSDSLQSKTTHSSDEWSTGSSTSSAERESRSRSRDSRTYDSRRRHRDRRTKPRRSSHSEMERLVSAISNHSRNTFVGAHDIIPKFDPGLKTQTSKSWIKKVNETADMYNWSDKQIIFHALPKLDGLARRWYEGLSSVNLSWREWQRKILENFPDDRNYADRLVEMLDRRSKREETLEEYFYDKIKLISHCNIKGKDAVDCVIHGIYDSNIRLNAQGANFRSPNKLLRYLRSITAKTFKDNRKTLTQPNNRINKSNFNGKGPDTSKNSRISGIKCFNCSENGHTAPRCTKEWQRCVKCNRMGHIAEHCRRDQANKITKTTTDDKKGSSENKVLHITGNNEKTNIYNKMVTINGHQKHAFLDFGSQCTIGKQSLADELSLKLDSKDLLHIRGFAFGTIQPIGKAKAEIVLDFVKAEVDIYIVPDEYLSTDLLIGQNFTERPGVVVYKTSTSLTLYSDFPEKVDLLIAEDTTVGKMTNIKIRYANQHTGYIYIPGNISYKMDEEIITIPGIYQVGDGVGMLPVINYSGKEVLMRKDKVIARALPIPNIPTLLHTPVLEVNNIIESDSTNSYSYKPLTMDMLNIGADATHDQRDRLLTLLNDYRDCFALELDELGRTSISEMHIKLQDDVPISYKPYRLPYTEKLVVRNLVNELLDSGIVRESNSSYASPIVLVKKKNGEYRLCVDYRALNKKTIKDSYPMPVIDDQLDRLSGKNYFTSLDLKSGYYQIPVAEDSKHLTAFITPDGHYEYTRMPFGLVNAPAVFQHMINKALGKDRYDLAMPYMDDLLSPATTIDDGLDKLRKILESLRKASLTLNVKKCYFFQTSLDYLGYEVSKDGLRPGSKKIDAVASFPVPTNIHHVRQFVGLASFFRRFIPNFGAIAKPLTSLTKANVPWSWEQPQEEAFNTIKAKLIQRPLLALYDPSFITEVHCDASKHGVGGILLQKPDEKSPLRPVAYFSKQTTKEEEFLHSYELETLAVVLSLKKFRIYLIGINFKVYTDCNALRTTLTKRDLVPRIARWWLLLQEYNFTIDYRPGESMRHVDALSRNPITSVDDPGLLDGDELAIMNIGTTDWLQSVQLADPHLKLVRSILNTDKRDIKDIMENYVLRNDKIYRKIGDQLKWVVPNGARWRICQMGHDESGHFSVDKTLDKIQKDFWFPKMTKFIKKYVSSCLNCAYNKASTGKSSGYLHPIPKGRTPFHTLHMDHLGPFVRSKNGNEYILGIIDGYSKFIFIKPVRNLKSKTTIKVLKDIFCVVGVPKIIISDRGTSFTSLLFKRYVQSIGVKHVQNSVATPRANGQIERYNRTILESLAASNHGQDERDWDMHIENVQWSLNNTRNKTTGVSPSEIVFGKRTTGPNEGNILNALREDDSVNTDNDEEPNTEESTDKEPNGNEPSRYELDREKQKSIIRELANKNIEDSQKQMKLRYDSNKAPTKMFNLGDLVMIPNHHLPATGKSKKLLPKFRGPYKISAVLKNDRYEISSIDGLSKRKYKSIYPADQLKKWITFNTDNNSDAHDLTDSDSDIN